jgi:hypothetical protein
MKYSRKVTEKPRSCADKPLALTSDGEILAGESARKNVDGWDVPAEADVFVKSELVMS